MDGLLALLGQEFMHDRNRQHAIDTLLQGLPDFLRLTAPGLQAQQARNGLQVVLEYVWQRVSRNRDKGIRTWVWIDEFSIMFNDGAGKTTHRSGEFFAKVYKRIRKYGGVPTAITQNITEVLTSPQAKTMLLNSEFVVLLQQRKEDLDTLQNLFSLSPSQQSYLKTGKKGSGLIVCGHKIIPFEKPIPTDSLMYHICTTKFGEV